MARTPWLKLINQRLSLSTSRRRQKAPRRTVRASRACRSGLESLEKRALLAATSVLLGGELQIVTSGNESVTVQERADEPGEIEVLINGMPLENLPLLQTTQIDSLAIVTGGDDNVINVSAVDQVTFPTLTQIRIETGNGDDVISGSPDIAHHIDAGDGDDSIDAGSAADTILAGDGDDTVNSLEGDDTIDAGDGNDLVDGGDGNDSVQAGDGEDQIAAGPGDDHVRGDDGQDTLDGGAGADTVFGDLGDDQVSGGDDGDALFGGGGRDTLNGDAGDDRLNGNGNMDSLLGGDGNDTLFGSASSDTLRGNDGDDFMNGGIGNDSLVGHAGDDSGYGGGGNDIVIGDSDDTGVTELGDDSLFGNAGNDTVIGVTGQDTIEGGDGDDLLRSTFELGAAIPPPPVPVPPTAPTPGTGTGSVLNDAVDSGGGTNVGAIHTMDNGPGDGSVRVTTDATGEFGTASDFFAFEGAVYDPVGPQFPAETTFESQVYFRPGNSGPRSDLNDVATNVSSIRGLSNEANSTFNLGGLTVALTQTIEQTFDLMGMQNGSLLTQTYRIMNPGATQSDFELVRYLDGDLDFDGTLIDGGGRLFTANSEEILFETDAGGGGATATTFVGITAFGGTVPTTNRFEIDSYFGLQDRIEQGLALDDLIFADLDGDMFVDAGMEYDVTLGLENRFSLAAGDSATYTTHTLFGSGAPSDAAANSPPMAMDDAVTFTSSGQTSVTIDVVSNDIDADGVLDFSSIQIVTPPANGTAVSLGNGLITYTPNPGFSGTDSFQYVISDTTGTPSSPATVTLNVFNPDPTGDIIRGGNGQDTIVGFNGDDLVDGGNGGDLIDGMGGQDTIYGGGGNDTINGGEGNDSLFGSGGHDVLEGNGGDDALVWRGMRDGNDSIDGSDGRDTVIIQGDALADVFSITASGSMLMAMEGTATLTIDAAIQNVLVDAQDGDDVITVGDLSSVDLTVLSISGDGGGDFVDLTATVAGGGVVLLVDGGVDNDRILGGGAEVSMTGGAGDDTLIGGDANDTLNGDEGEDSLNGGNGNDTINGGVGNDAIDGDDGNDLISGNEDSDTVDAGAGDDTVFGNFGDDFLNGSFGNDSVIGGLGRDLLLGGAGNDTLRAGHNDDTIRGHSGDDLLVGSHGNDLIVAAAGDDTVNAGDGNDTVDGGSGNDLIGGFDGHDSLLGNDGNDSILAGNGDDSINGAGGMDTVLGGDGIDAVNGGGASDTGAVGEGLDPAPVNVETIDESFVFPQEVLDALNA